MDDANLDALLKVRCRHELIERLEAIAKSERRRFPDFIRLILDDYATAQEKLLDIGNSGVRRHGANEPAERVKAGPSDAEKRTKRKS